VFFFKNLTYKEFLEISEEYPIFENFNIKEKKNEKKQYDINQNKFPISCITFVRNDKGKDNYIKLKKIKIYIDNLNNKIIKILQN